MVSVSRGRICAFVERWDGCMVGSFVGLASDRRAVAELALAWWCSICAQLGGGFRLTKREHLLQLPCLAFSTLFWMLRSIRPDPWNCAKKSRLLPVMERAACPTNNCSVDSLAGCGRLQVMASLPVKLASIRPCSAQPQAGAIPSLQVASHIVDCIAIRVIFTSFHPPSHLAISNEA